MDLFLHRKISVGIILGSLKEYCRYVKGLPDSVKVIKGYLFCQKWHIKG